MFSIPYFVVLINIYPSIVTIIHRILTYFRRNISLKHMFFKELRNISNKKAKVHAIFVQVIPAPSAGDNHCILFSKCYSDFDDRFYTCATKGFAHFGSFWEKRMAPEPKLRCLYIFLFHFAPLILWPPAYQFCGFSQKRAHQSPCDFTVEK